MPSRVQVLKRQGPNDFLGALMALPRNLRTIYIHAYQSYLVRCTCRSSLLLGFNLLLLGWLAAAGFQLAAAGPRLAATSPPGSPA